MTLLFQILNHLGSFAIVIFALFVLMFCVCGPFIILHEHWFVWNAVRFKQCPACSAANSLRLMLSPDSGSAFSNHRFGRFVRCRACGSVLFAFPSDRVPGFMTWHGNVEFDVCDKGDSDATIAQQPKLWWSCLFIICLYGIFLVPVAASLVIHYYLHAIIVVVVAIGVVWFQNARFRLKGKSTK